MSNPSGRQYFLGIGGEQTGPYLEQDVLNRIRQGSVPPDALVWFEGLPDWQPIQSIEFLKGAFSEAPPPPAPAFDETPDLPMAPASPAPRPAPAYTPSAGGSGAFDPNAMAVDANLFAGGGTMQTVFSEAEASFAKGGGSKTKMLALLGVLVVVAVGAVGMLLFDSDLFSGSDQTAAQLNVKRLPAQDDRTTRLRKALSELLLLPDESVPVLQALVKENPNDAVGKEATDALVEHYKTRQNPSEAGRLLMQLGRPLEASQLFLSDPPSYREAEEAIFAAYKISNDANKRDLLIQDIRLLLGQANNVPLAVERIRLLESEFKGFRHPFGYYLNSVDARLADIFNRISFYFVQRLMTYIETEFPQMSLTKRPIIEIRKDKRRRYRIVGRYEGDILLNQDRLTDTYMTFWHVGEAWVVVDTNITPERATWAREEQSRVNDAGMSGEDMLQYMENLFRSQFPKAALHEAVAPPPAPSKNIRQ